MASARVILHVDLDAFYAAVEQRDDPRLRGRPVIVGGPAPRGVVATASYEARRFGVHSAMPTAQALQRCPQAVLLHPRIAHYAAISDRFFEILERYSPLVEGLSLDEAFLDVTGEERLFGDGRAIATRIKAEVREELSLVVSVGVAPSKFVAKVASDLSKPDGLIVVAPDGVLAFLAPLPIGRLWGVGEVTEKQLAAIGLRTIGDVAAMGEALLAPRIGPDRAAHLARLAVGDDAREVVPERAPVSVGCEDTFEHDHHDAASLRPPLLAQADHACARLRRLGMRARTVTIKVKYGDHTLVTRRVSLDHATADGRVVAERALALLGQVPDIARRGVRLTGISLSGLEDKGPGRQLRFDEPALERGEKLGETLDAIRARWGRGAVRRAVHLDESPVLPGAPKKPT